jgi:heptosyltransferase I
VTEERSGSPQRILLVRLRLLGDVVFTTPVIRALRRKFPDAHLSYLVEPPAAAVVRRNPHLNEVIVAPKGRGLARWMDDIGIARRLRRERYDVVIDLHGGPRAAWLAWSTRAPMRIGYTIKGRSWMYTHAVPRADDLLPRHSVVNQWDLLTPLGIEAPDPARDAIELIEDPDAVRSVEAKLCAAGVGPEHAIVVIHVSAGNPFRRWPAAAFVTLAVRLAAADARRRIVMTSGPSEADAASRIVSAAREQLGPEGYRVIAPLWTLQNCTHSPAARRCTLGGIADRSMWPAPRSRRLLRCSVRRFRSDRCRGAIRGGLRRQWMRDRFRAVRADSGCA